MQKMTKHILLRLGIAVVITMLVTAGFLLLFNSGAEPFGVAVYSVAIGIILEILYAIYLCIESIRLFRNRQTGLGMFNLSIALIILTVGGYITDYYLIKIF